MDNGVRTLEMISSPDFSLWQIIDEYMNIGFPKKKTIIQTLNHHRGRPCSSWSSLSSFDDHDDGNIVHSHRKKKNLDIQKKIKITAKRKIVRIAFDFFLSLSFSLFHICFFNWIFVFVLQLFFFFLWKW